MIGVTRVRRGSSSVVRFLEKGIVIPSVILTYDPCCFTAIRNHTWMLPLVGLYHQHACSCKRWYRHHVKSSRGCSSWMLIGRITNWFCSDGCHSKNRIVLISSSNDGEVEEQYINVGWSMSRIVQNWSGCRIARTRTYILVIEQRIALPLVDTVAWILPRILNSGTRSPGCDDGGEIVKVAVSFLVFII